MGRGKVRDEKNGLLSGREGPKAVQGSEARQAELRDGPHARLLAESGEIEALRGTLGANAEGVPESEHGDIWGKRVV